MSNPFRSTPFACLSLLTLATAPPAAAQRGEPPRDAAPISGSVRALEYTEEGELWAYGATYKARLGAEGLMVIPPLGPDAREDLPLWLSLESIAVGGVELDLGGAVEPRREALTAEYARGAGVTERYEVRSEGLEQTFVLNSLPTRGEIVVRQRVATDLLPRAEDGGLFFAGNETNGQERGLLYGALTAVDARGARAAGEVRLVGATIELRVPADFVATAELPLVLDPLIGGPIDLFLLAGEVGDPDVSESFWTHEQYFVVFERRWSSTDIDVYGQRVDNVGGLAGTTVVFEGSVSPVSMNPAVATSFDDVADGLVVWQQGSSVSGPFDIKARGFPFIAGDPLQSTITISSATGSDIDPCVAPIRIAEYTGLGCIYYQRYMVAWSRSGIRARAVDICEDHLPYSFFLGDEITVTTNVNDSLPAISYLGSIDFMAEVFLVWQRFFSTPAPGDNDLHRAVIRDVWPDDKVFVLTVTDAALVTTIGPDETKPDVVDILGASDPGQIDIAVTYERSATSSASDDDVFLARVPVTQVGLGTLLDPPLITNIAVGTGDDDGPALTRYWGGGEQVWLGWISHGSFGFSGVNGVSLQSPGTYFVDPNYGLTLCENEYSIAGAPTGAAFQDLEMDNGVGEAIAVFESIGFGVYAQLLDTYHYLQGVGGFGWEWPGCGAGGYASRICPCAEGSNFVHALEQAAPARPAFLIMSFDQLFQSCGSCTLVANPYTGFVVAAGNTSATGVAKVPMAIPSPGTLVGTEFYDQWAVLDPAPACAAFGVSLSSAVRFAIDAF